jgi:hypothetical protein
MNNNEKPKYAVTPVTGRAVIPAGVAGALGANTNAQTAYPAAPAEGGRCYGLIASTDDTSAVNLLIQIEKGNGDIIPLGLVNVPANSGNAASTPMVDLLSASVCPGLPIDNMGKRYIELAGGDKVIVSTLAAITATKKCIVSSQGASYA